jgi:CRP-like cAMP-binding protein
VTGVAGTRPLRPTQHRAILEATRLLRGLTPVQLDCVAAIGQARAYAPGEYLLREGEPDRFVYVLVAGRALLVKNTSLGGPPSRIGELRAGDTFGELKIVDPRPSTASVVADTPVTAVAIDLDVFERDEALAAAHAVVWRNVGQILAERLQRTSVTGADAIHRELEESEARAYAARFIVFMFCMFGVFELAVSAVTLLPRRPPDSILSFVFIVWTVIPVVLSLRGTPFTLASYGLTLRRGWHHALWGLIWTAPVLGLFLILKIILVQTVPSMAGRPLFDPEALFAGRPFDWGFFALAAFLYAVHTPIQEFVARAGLQGSMQHFLRVPPGRADWKAIVISNLVFASAHTYLGFWFAIAAFASGLFWGWLFARQGSLIAPIVSHLAVGYWAIFVLGIHALIGGG